MAIYQKIVVAGIPRNGTTFIYRLLGGKPQTWQSNGLLKTHGLAPPDNRFINPQHKTVNQALLCNGYKAIFLFGDPVCSILSTIRKINDWIHFKNCGVIDKRPRSIDLTQYDYLHYEMMFDSWMDLFHPYPVICMRYEALGNYSDILNHFLGIDLDLSKWNAKGRYTNPEKDFDRAQRIRKTYASLIKKVEEAPNWRICGVR